MKIICTLFIFGCALGTTAQVTTTIVLDQNNVAAEISDGGIFFTSGGSSFPGYEVPAGSGINSMFALTYWFGGTDVNGGLKMAIPVYGDQSDLFPGPLTQNAAVPGIWPTSLFPVTKSEIDNHILNYASVGYIIPPSIVNWPAHGDVSLGFDYYLAPFVDVDADGNYVPSNGDYPCILGDKAIYVINNDKGDLHDSGTDPIGIEIHSMIYQYTTNDDLNNATFVRVTVINRGTQTLFDYRMSVFADTDIGNYTDDYMGTDSIRNMMFAYNGDAYDEDFAGYPGYGNMPPAIGIKSLDRAIVNAHSYDPSMAVPAQYMNAMLSTGYDFPGNPYTLTGDSEESLGNSLGDRRMFYTISPGILYPWDTYYHDFVILFSGAATNRLENVNQLYNIADEIQLFYDTNIAGICVLDPTLSLVGTESQSFEIFPNPTSGAFTVNLSEMEDATELQIVDLTGKVVFTKNIDSSDNSLNVSVNVPNGMYFVNILSSNNLTVSKLIVRN